MISFSKPTRAPFESWKEKGR
jgi:hypothetical protein